MKKIFILLLMVIPLIASGQAKHRQGEVVGDPSNVVVDSVEKVGTVLMHYVDGDVISLYNDSIATLEADLDRAINRIAVLEGADVTAPYPDSAYILPNVDTIIYVTFNETFDPNATFTVDAAFSFTYGATSYTAGSVDSVDVGGGVAAIYSGINIPTDSVVYVSYARPGSGGLRDEDGNYVADFDTLLVFNSVSTSYYEPLAHYKFNGDLTDETGSYNGSAVNTIAYDGDSAIIFSEADGNDAVLLSNMISGSDFSIEYMIYLDEDANEDYYIFANTYSAGGAGFYHYANGSGAGTFNMTTMVRDGVGGSTFAYEDQSINDDTWYHIVSTYDVDGNGTNAYNGIYINGTKANDNDSIFANFANFTTTGDLYIGSEAAGSPSNGLREGAKLKNFKIFDYSLGQWEIDSLYAIYQAYEERLWQTTSTQTPPDYSTNRTVYETIDFTGETPGATVNEALVDTWFAGDGAPTSSLYQEIEAFQGDTVIRFELPAIEANLGVQWQYDMPSSYEEVWFSYNFYLPADFIMPYADGKFPGVSVGGTTTSIPTGGVQPYYCPAGTYLQTWGSTLRGWLIQDRYHSPFPPNSDPVYGVDGVGMYAYYHNMVYKPCGTTTSGNKFPVYEETNGHWTWGEWNNLTFRIKANTVTVEGTGDANGLIEIYANGICRYTQENMILRNYSEDLIDEYFILLLGTQDSYRDRVQYVRFDDFELWMPNPDTNLRGAVNTIGTNISSFITEK